MDKLEPHNVIKHQCFNRLREINEEKVRGKRTKKLLRWNNWDKLDLPIVRMSEGTQNKEAKMETHFSNFEH